MTDPGSPLRRRSTTVSVLAGFLSLLSASALALLFGHEAWPELLAGCATAVLNGIAHAIISVRSIGARPDRFLRWGIVMNALRVAIVLGILTTVCFFSQMRMAPFALSLVTGTVVFLVCNAAAMARADCGGDSV